MRLVALLLLVAAIGFAVGRLTAPEAGGLRGQRSAAPPVVPHALAPEPDPVEASVPAAPLAVPAAVEQTVETYDAPDDVVLPSGAADNAYWPNLEVDFEGFQGERAAWIAKRTMMGGIEQEKFEAAADGVARTSPEPGTYEVWWFDAEGTRRGARVRIEEGQLTRVRAVDCGTAPLPKGLGALKVELSSLSGGVLAGQTVFVGWADGWTSDGFTTDSRGQADALVALGRYRVFFADYESEIVVEEGKTTFHRIVHGREGDLVLVADRPRPIRVEAVGRDADYDACFDGAEAVVPYLGAGEYDVVLEGLVPLGRVTIRAGQTTRFRCELPSGGITVRVLKPGQDKVEADVKIRRAVDDRKTWRSVRGDKSIDLTLPPGRYVVSASSRECESPPAEVSVANGVVELTLELRPR